MKEYNGRKVFTIKKDGRFLDVYEDNPNFDCEQQLKHCENALKNYDNYINSFKESNQKLNSKMPHWSLIICCGLVLALSGCFSFALSNIPLFVVAILSGTLGGYFSIKKARLIRKIKENNQSIEIYKNYQNGLTEEMEYLEVLIFNKTHKDVKIYNKYENQTNYAQKSDQKTSKSDSVIER